MGNSSLFISSLEKGCTTEDAFPSFPVSGLSVGFENGTKRGSKRLILEQIDTMPCLPYRKLRELLELNDRQSQAYKAWLLLDTLQESEFSIQQLIDGCANALRFDSEKSRLHEIMQVARVEYRDSHLITKNHLKGSERAKGRSIAALVLEPSISNATRRNTGNDQPVSIELHRYGCAYYQQDRLQSSHHPSTAALLSFNLAYIFRNWPVVDDSFPTYPPKKQPRGKRPAVNNGPPRLDIVAPFVNALFPPTGQSQDECTTYDSEQIKNLLNKMKAAKAIFCGW